MPLTAAPGLAPAVRFAGAMRALLPQGRPQAMAVALSGGADSTALALLASDWAAERGVRLIALTVDHGLRREAAAEAAAVAQWCRARRLEHATLRWAGPVPASGLQASARQARYRLLSEACRLRGVRHLLLAHQRDDQVETMLLRLAAGSGPGGAAGMSALARRGDLLLLRPLLGWPRSALLAFLSERGGSYCEDPSNRDPRFARARLRRVLAGAPEPLVERLAGAAKAFGRIRQAWGAAVGEAMQAVAADPLGYFHLPMSALDALPPPLALRLLGHLLHCLGGRAHAPALAAVRAARQRFAAAGPVQASLAGCLLRRAGGDMLVVRESRGLPPAGRLWPGAELRWDRFLVARPPADRLQDPVCATALGRRAWRPVLTAGDPARLLAVPAPARPGLLAIEDRDGLAGLPQLGLWRAGLEASGVLVRFQPVHELVPHPFVIVC